MEFTTFYDNGNYIAHEEMKFLISIVFIRKSLKHPHLYDRYYDNAYIYFNHFVFKLNVKIFVITFMIFNIRINT